MTVKTVIRAGMLATVLALALPPALAVVAQPGRTLDIYFIDVEGGQSTLVVTPAGQSLLIDTGFAGFDGRDAGRIVEAARAAGITQIDYLLLTHFHWDLDPQEWRHNNKKRTVDYVTKQLGRMTGRNVLLMHDIKKATVDALPEILAFIEAENAKRKETRRRRIRIIQAWEIAVEQLPPGTMEWLREVTPSRKSVVDAIASVLP